MSSLWGVPNKSEESLDALATDRYSTYMNHIDLNNRNLRTAENYIGASHNNYEDCLNNCDQDDCNCAEEREVDIAEARAEALAEGGW